MLQTSCLCTLYKCLLSIGFPWGQMHKPREYREFEKNRSIVNIIKMLNDKLKSYQQVANKMASPFISVLFNKSRQCSILVLAPKEFL